MELSQHVVEQKAKVKERSTSPEQKMDDLFAWCDFSCVDSAGQERIIFPVAASTKTTGYIPLWAAGPGIMMPGSTKKE